MDARLRSLLVSVIAALAGLVALDVVYGRYAKRHFIPNATLRAAEAQGDDCVVTLGDSRMAAGIDPAALAAGLRTGGAPRCVAPLGIGALPISGSAMALRRYLDDGRRPAAIVLGESAGTLLPEVARPDPGDLVGNRAAELEWSRASDVAIYYPGFPFGDLDRGIRFSLARTNALETYESATWLKVKAVQERLTGGARTGPSNRFGMVADMQSLLAEFQTKAVNGLAHFDGHWKASPWLEVLRKLVHQLGLRLIVIEVPMRSSYRAEVLASPAAVRYMDWLRAELAHGGDVFLDVSSPRSVTDDDFRDGLHLGEDGARRFSTELGERVAPFVQAAAR